MKEPTSVIRVSNDRITVATMRLGRSPLSILSDEARKRNKVLTFERSGSIYSQMITTKVYNEGEAPVEPQAGANQKTYSYSTSDKHNPHESFYSYSKDGDTNFKNFYQDRPGPKLTKEALDELLEQLWRRY